MFGLIRKYRELLSVLALLALPTITFLAHRKAAARRNRVDQALLWATGPIERAIVWVVGGTIDGAQGLFALRHVREENERLRQELFGARTQLQELDELRRENDRLRQLTALVKPEPMQLLGAKVIGDSLAPGELSRVIRIGAGEREGVRRGMAVLAQGGVVGRVLGILADSADVQLVMDPASAVAVRAERSRARATVSGTGRDDRCRLDFALRSDDLEAGDRLVTSGTDGVFPAGVPVGEVIDLQRRGSGMFVRASVAPAIDPRRLEEVDVVLDSTPASAASR
ncbi:MAG: rod shape-determining protein MreC [Deltaproteobacteria bacterium]